MHGRDLVTMSSVGPVRVGTSKLERKLRDKEGQEEEWKEALPGASEGDGLILSGVERHPSAGVSTISKLHRVTTRCEDNGDRVVHLDRSDVLAIHHDVVRATTNLDSD